ncbi:MAG TPA: head-tail connector protein [Nocardioides sp.]
MGALDILPLDVAKTYLNFRGEQNDAELATFIPPAVERVERHLGRTLDPATVTAIEVLAVKVVLAEYWRTQRANYGRSSYGGGASGAAIEADSGPAGEAPLRVRLTELLGDPATGTGAAAPEPLGSFPSAQAWPDPITVSRGSCRW